MANYPACSDHIKEYFTKVEHDVQAAFDHANLARKESFDPTTEVEVKLAKNLAERVVGLISIISPQVVGTDIVPRIVELEQKYGNQDWRVAMVIAHEVAQEKFCKFENQIEAIEVGIRIGFAYVTVGVVSSPIEGFTHLELKDRRDGKGKYFCMHYAGPVRNAGGTAAATSVVIADYVRKQMGFAKYDPDEKEQERCYVEIMDYHDRVTNLQYVPSREESIFMVTNCPIEIAGDASEAFEVSNYKDLPRVPTNRIRSGFCLIHSSCLPLKAPKLWKKISKWYEEMQMQDWCFLEEFIHIQHEAKSKAKGSKPKKEVKHDEEKKVDPIFTYIADLVGGRPVFSHPLRSGGFRLRYGRGRVSGYSAQSIHPATMAVLDDFIAIGTQLKVERPGKAAAFTTCDTIEGPRVLLNNGDVLFLQDTQQANKVKHRIKQILYLGDVLINYGDFFDRAHPLIPSGYCEEWWTQEVAKSIKDNNVGVIAGIEQSRFTTILENAKTVFPTFAEALSIASSTKTPLHPKHTYFYNEVSFDDLLNVKEALSKEKNTIPFSQTIHNALALLGVPLTVNEEQTTIALEDDIHAALTLTLSNISKQTQTKKSNVATLNSVNDLQIRDMSGTFIGARMGRPEKGKQRKMSSSPHGLFPVADQGGRLKSFQSCLELGFIQADCAAYWDKALNGLSPLARSHIDDTPNEKVSISPLGQKMPENTEGTKANTIMKIPFPDIYRYSLKKMGLSIGPDLIKGVQGTVNADHYCEHPAKAIMRAHHGIFVNKDGTVRYDASEIPITHFKPSEVRTSVSRLRELGYTKDMHGNELTDPDQVCELIPQDILLPCCNSAPFAPADEVLFNTAKFVDDILVKLYKQKPYYNISSADDLAGHYIIGLAPHTSAGTVGRIIGFTDAQGMYCHPMYHAAMRRDCDGDESCYVLLMDAFLNFSTKYLPSSRGGTMDAPLVLTSILDPSEVDDMVFNLDISDTYDLDFYQAALEHKMPWDVKVPLFEACLHKPEQYEGILYTHETTNINDGVLCSAYKTLPSMGEKVQGQMALAEKIRAVDEHDVARIVIQTHFIRDTRGNLRKYSQQEFRCVKCNTKYRRPPLRGICTQENCGGKILFTISQGSIVKYLAPSLELAERYAIPPFLKESLELTQMHIDGIFGREAEKQTGLGQWFSP